LTRYAPQIARVLLALTLSIACSTAIAMDVVKFQPIIDYRDISDNYYYDILKASLDVTSEAYGPYEVEVYQHAMVSQRMLVELTKGENLTVAVSPYKAAWEGKTLIVPFPVNKGLSSYRMFFARKHNLPILKNLTSLEQLKIFRFGQGRGWSTAKILEDNGFHVVYSDTYHAFPNMLTANRFDLFMRGTHEVIWEKAKFASSNPDLTVVESFALFTYLPSYINVNKAHPKIAERLEVGLKKLNASGELDKTFQKSYTEAIRLISSANRKVFFLENTNLPPGIYERDKPYLLDVGFND